MNVCNTHKGKDRTEKVKELEHKSYYSYGILNQHLHLPHFGFYYPNVCKLQVRNLFLECNMFTNWLPYQ